MLNLRKDEIIEKIKKEEIFSAICIENSLKISIDKYVPFICLAIHNGEDISKKLKDKLEISDFERWQEEDPLTGDFIESMPIKIIANESRYMYDLNRSEENAVYDIAWGKKVWKEELTDEEKESLKLKHRIFYEIIYCLIKKINDKFESLIIYDIHSYNFKRIVNDSREYPIFNLGTEKVNEKYRKTIDYFLNKLEDIEIENIETTARENDVFFGRGYLLEYINNNFENVLVLATEIKKIYVNEKTEEVYHERIEQLKNGLKQAIIETSSYFFKKNTKYKSNHKYKLLSSELDDYLIKVDNKIYNVFKKIDILQYVNPTNIDSQKKIFFASKFKKEPNFKYKLLNIDTYNMKRILYSLPIDKIEDINLQMFYKDIIEYYSQEIDLLATRNTPAFKYNSLKIYGEPSSIDIKNANYLLHTSNNKLENKLNSEEAKKVLEYAIESYNFKWKIEITKKITARAVVSSGKKVLKLRQDALFSKKDIRALAAHEVGVHILTTENSKYQKLKILRIGMPGYTETQEGIALLSEYLSGNLEMERLHNLAYRTKAVSMMLKGHGFKEIFEYFVDQYNLSLDDSFYLVTRIFRGGGFTKDYVYLKGLTKVYNFYKNRKDLSNLLIGKTSLDYIDVFDELIERNILKKPKDITREFRNESQKDEIIDFILSNLK